MGAATSSTLQASKENVGHQSSTSNGARVTGISIVESQSLKQRQAISISTVLSASPNRPVYPKEDDVFSAHSQAQAIQPEQDEANYPDSMGAEEMESPTPPHQRKLEKSSRKGEIAKTPRNTEVRLFCVNVLKQTRNLMLRPQPSVQKRKLGNTSTPGNNATDSMAIRSLGTTTTAALPSLAQDSLKRKAVPNEEVRGRKRRMTIDQELGVDRDKPTVVRSLLGKDQVESDDEELGVESINANVILAEIGMVGSMLEDSLPMNHSYSVLQAEKAKVKRQRLEADRAVQTEGSLDLPTANDEQTVVGLDAETTTIQPTGLQPMMKEENDSLKRLREVRIVNISKTLRC